MARNRKHIYKHFIYHINNNINTTRLEKIFLKIFFTTKKFGFYYCLYEFVFIYQMDRCYHLTMSKYSNLLWLIYCHFLPSASIFFTVLVYFLRRIISHFYSVVYYTLFSNTQQYFFYLLPTPHNPTHHSAGGGKTAS